MVGSILRHGELWLAFTGTDGRTTAFVFLDFMAAFGDVREGIGVLVSMLLWRGKGSRERCTGGSKG